MAKPKPPDDSSPGRLLVSPSQFSAELKERIDRGAELLGVEVGSAAEYPALRDDYYTWDEYNTQLLRRRFSSDELVREYSDAAFLAGGFEQSLEQKVNELHHDFERKIRRLKSIVEQVPLFQVDPSVSPADSRPTSPVALGSEIFVVHGRNEAVKLEVATFLERLAGRRPVILHEHASEGRTVIEKLEHYGRDTNFAIVLLTADDEGRLRGSSDEPLPRGRQNVVLELGYFMARLGRSRVVLLYESDVELPSDMTGVVYTRLDSAGGWKLTLARELQAAEIPVDLNRAM
jgi:predicted nucleotide-binding protein